MNPDVLDLLVRELRTPMFLAALRDMLDVQNQYDRVRIQDFPMIFLGH
jgi:hypothetical protein